MDDDTVLLVLGAIWLASKYTYEVAPTLREAGKTAYETLHPKEKNHANDLPGHQMTKEAIEALAASVGFPDPHFAMAIAMAESGGVPNSIGDGGISIGLWQINTRAHPRFSREAMADPIKNARAAFEISHQGRDWYPWSVFRNNTYQRFL